jgi:hypothetical protein
MSAPNANNIAMVSIPFTTVSIIARSKNTPFFCHHFDIVVLQVVLISSDITTRVITFANTKLNTYIARARNPIGIPTTVIKQRIARIGIRIKYSTPKRKLFPIFVRKVIAVFWKKFLNIKRSRLPIIRRNSSLYMAYALTKP